MRVNGMKSASGKEWSQNTESRAAAARQFSFDETSAERPSFSDERNGIFTQFKSIHPHSSHSSIAQLAISKNKKKKKAPASTPRVKRNKRIESYYTRKHYRFALSDDPKDAIYNKHIDDLVDGLDADRRDYSKFTALEDKGKQYFGRKKIRNLINARKRNITEKVGELNATQYMNKNHSSARLIYGFEKGVGFDQVYKDGSTIYVVEAKGPGAKLGFSDLKGKQMSKSWVMATARGMRNRSVRKRILRAANEDNLIGIVVSSTPKGNTPKNAKYIDY